MTDFSSLLSQPKLMLLGAAAQMGIYFTLLGALFLGFLPKEAASIAIIGGADGNAAFRYAIFRKFPKRMRLLGAAGVSAVPGSAREVHLMGLSEDPSNFLLMPGMACNSSGVIGLAICAGILWSFFI